MLILVALFPNLAFGSKSQQTDAILDQILTSYKVGVHPETDDDQAVVVKLKAVPLHLHVVRISQENGKLLIWNQSLNIIAG